MKTKNRILLSIFMLTAMSALNAQDYKVSVENPKDVVLSLSGFGGDLTVEGYAGSEIVFASTELDMEVPERAKGLKPVYSGGTDNTGVGLSVVKNGNQITVNCLLPFTRHGNYTVKVPENISVKITSGCEYNSNILIRKVKNEIEIQACHNLTLQDVSGPLVLSTIAGNIDISFASLNTDKPFSINSISGEIDMTLPAKIAADIEMGTVTGTMYSDFDLADTGRDMKRVGGNQLNTKLNGGGTKFSIVTVSGNIYLRKGL